MAVVAEATRRRAAIISALDTQLAALDPVIAVLTGLRVTFNLRPDGSPRSIVLEPQMRSEGA